MSIAPIQSVAPIAGQQAAGSLQGVSQSQLPFQSFFEDALKTFEETTEVKDADSRLLATGDVDDIDQILINARKADISMQLLVQMRNKVLDAYSEIMRISI